MRNIKAEIRMLLDLLERLPKLKIVDESNPLRIRIEKLAFEKLELLINKITID